MPVTRSQNNSRIMGIEEPTSCSFTVDLEEDNTNGHRRSTRSQLNITEGRMRQMMNESIGNLREEMINVISNEIRALVSNVNIGEPQNIVPTVTPQVVPVLGEQSSFGSLNTERVLNIIRNWKLKFTGYSYHMSVDEFIYRVNIHTDD